MNELVVQAPAKLNLTLDVLGRQPNGYHELKMVMQSVTLADTVTLRRLEAGEGAASNTVQVRTNLTYLPSDGNNLAAKAAHAFFAYAGLEGAALEIQLKKRIPVCAGTAGGSSDAAAVLRGLNELYRTGFSREMLAKIGEQVGSDVPYCVLGGTALAEGRGEKLTPLYPLPDCWLVLCKPGFAVSTPELFHAIDNVRLRRHPDTDGMLAALEAGNLREVALRMYNVFEDVLPTGRQGVIQEIKGALLDGGALGACMSGTGPTVFGLFADREQAEATARRLKETYRDTFLTQNLQ
ncbi:MAG: 4-(cytidine 5'-diphospho)-2-C-methyl-D-erythritol kinase [Oscillospiraceae bacterium]|nr:4-(cytidine 5'-diphospho)-2-C-methyl-D-erythritol kinase [Oscillospiraceae bacterium]